jgi:dTDP-4-amino-4,6-dideoxygalactose transaminase
VRLYRERLARLAGVEIPWDASAVERSTHFAFPILLADRDARDRFREELKASGVQTTWYPALCSFSEYRDAASPVQLSMAIEAADRHCVLPLSCSMDEAALDTVVQAVEDALS